eukprot:TRINITY_DN2312_c1_g1_i1.p1 TRINITY_DN2312_c1_g1~~TRINITY_DN2312_c1_g1_i1.p1  ORF type:complete len:1006 (-),score=210.43 TRINITY_DN2312_c1_g1_i1:26-2773(-)
METKRETVKGELNAEALREQKRVNYSQVKHLISNERSEIFRRMASGTRKQNNFSVADKYLRMSLKSMETHTFDFPFFHTLVKLHCLKAAHAPAAESIEKFVKALKYLDGKRNEEILQSNTGYMQRFYMTEAGIYASLYERLNDYPESIKDALAKAKLSSYDTQKGNKDTRSGLISTTYSSYSSAIKLFDSCESSKFSGRSFLKFGLFCDNIVKEGLANIDAEKLMIKTVELLLDAMRRGSMRAVDRFPRLLQLLVKPKVGEVFKKEIRSIPNWMTLGWVSQMMAILDKPEGEYILPLLEGLARDYPQAIVFPFSISTENIREDLLPRLENMRESLKNDLIDTFIKNLEMLTHPEHRFKDWADAIKPLLPVTDRNGKTVSKGNPKEARELWKQCWHDCFDEKVSGIGSYNKAFAKTWRTAAAKKFGENGAELAKMTQATFTTAFSGLNEQMKSRLTNATTKQNLTEFSTWLSNFEQSDFLDSIELPGQYTGKVKPNPDHHTKISSFDGSLLVMGSMRKPKRLKFRGNDECDYPFLVKGGEDLRLDQRIQQIFTIVNEILAQDANTSKRKLKVHTYKVVPMTNRVGIIEWVDNTSPLKRVIEDELAKDSKDKSANILKLDAAKVHETWLRSLTKSKAQGVTELYYNMFTNASRENTIKKVLEQEKSVPWDLLRRGIMSLCSGPEAYLLLRSQFARTLASFSISSYIIGIGDRHLDNFLLNMKNGGIIGIDFGHAFGTATQFLPIPELMPFRLTRQLTNFLLPLDTEGLLKHNMVHTLQALQDNQEILLNTMDVFVQEPLLDWEKLARRLATQQRANSDDPESANTWFPRKKIEIAKMKLNRINPAYITWKELNESVHEKKPYLKSLQSVVMGDHKHNVRAHVKEKCESARQQVDCLVDMATDPNILGRSWAGWAAYI